jgi:hypothetical protein
MPVGDRDMPTGGSFGASNRGGGPGTNRYCDEKKEWRTRGFSLEVVMEHRWVPQLLVALANTEGWPISILRVHVADSSDGDLVGTEGASPGGDSMRSMMPSAMKRSGSGAPPGTAGGLAGRGAPPSAMPSAMPKPSPSRRLERDSDSAPSSNAPSALDDPNLAKVSIVGVVYIFLQPKELPVTTPPAQTPGAPATAPVATAPADPTAATSDTAGSSDEAGVEGDPDEKPESKTDESTDEPAAAAPDAGADPKPKPDAEGKSGSGDSR